MSASQIIFLFLAALLLTGAAAVVTMRNLFHAALCMVVCFFAVAGLFALLDASFLAAATLMIGVGAIAILIIFAIMLTRHVRATGATTRWPLALLATISLFGILTTALTRFDWPTIAPPMPADSLTALGQAIVGPFMLPFEASSVMLLAALIGSIYIARERK
jgi:NADH-quinone oxidoreductase subunit J